MSVEAACGCGARFRAEAHLYGKEVNCPTCGQKFKVPSPQPTKMAVQCSCGARYQVASTMVGQRVQCQACKQAFVVGATPSAAPSDPFGGAAPDPFGDLGGDPLGGGGAMGFPGASQPAAGASPFGAPGMGAPGFGAPAYGASAAPFQPMYPGAPAGRSASGAGGKLALKVLVIGAIVLIGLLAVGGGGWFAFSLFAGGHSSPQAVFNAAQTARRNKDFKAVFQLITPDSQEQLAGTLVFVSVMGMEREPGLGEILQKHGVNAAEFKTKYNVSPSNPLALLTLNAESFKNMSSAVSNKASFAADVARYGEERRAAQGQTGAMGLPGMTSDDNATLQDVVIEGDEARGKQVASVGGRTIESQIHFRRVGGRWYLHIPMNMANPFGARKG